MLMQELIDLAKDCKTIVIAGHIHPDGDCIGACLALVQILEKYGISSTPILVDIADTYNFLKVIDKVEASVKDEEIDLFISVDCGDKSRLGKAVPAFNRSKLTVNIDHHVSNIGFAQRNYVVTDVSSTCEILYSMLADTSVLDKAIAEALYTGIIYDTGVFKHDSTGYETHRIAGELTKYGINATEIINQLFFYKSFTAFKLLGIACQQAELALDDKLIISSLTPKQMQSVQADKNDTDGIIAMMNEVKGTECAVFIYPMNSDMYKVSLRSRGHVNVCHIAQQFGGGGHTKAAGCSLTGSLNSIKKKLIEEASKQL